MGRLQSKTDDTVSYLYRRQRETAEHRVRVDTDASSPESPQHTASADTHVHTNNIMLSLYRRQHNTTSVGTTALHHVTPCPR